jgi:hypothetical protein
MVPVRYHSKFTAQGAGTAVPATQPHLVGSPLVLGVRLAAQHAHVVRQRSQQAEDSNLIHHGGYFRELAVGSRKPWQFVEVDLPRDSADR